MRVTLQPSGAVLDTLPGEPILNAAQRLGYECPQSCRNGNCHVCAALLVEGSVQQAGETRDRGEIYTCLAQPQEDCIVLWDGVLALGELPVKTVSCQLVECVEMGGDVWRVRLRAPAGKAPRYYAGQYVMLERENGEKSAFSLASAPHSGRDLELHVLVREDSARSLIEHCRKKGFPYPVHLYWGVRRPEDFYTLEEWDAWQKIPNLYVHKVVSDLCGWEGRCGLLHEAVCEDISDLSSVYVYASGSPAMVYGTLDALVNAGMDAHQMRADVFAYCPRP